MEILKAWNLVSRLPARGRIFNLCLHFVVPYTATIGSSVEELRSGYARVGLKDHRKVRNHLKSIHAIALANLCEQTSGLAVIAQLGTTGRGILVGFEMEYLKKARGRLTCECTAQVPEIKQRVEFVAEPVVKDEAGDVVCKAKAHWLLQPV